MPVVPAMAARAPSAPPSDASAPGWEEISETPIALTAASVAHAAATQQAGAPASHRNEISDTSLRDPPRAPIAVSVQEAGVVEIVSDVALAAASSPAGSVRPPPVPPTAPLSALTTSEATPTDVSGSARPKIVSIAVEPPPAAPSSAPLSPTSGELIQHVLRWVGQNPQTVLPPALVERSTPIAPAQAIAPAPAQPEPARSIIAAPSMRGAAPSTPSPVPARSAPPRAPSPAVAAAAHEASVEISIGTLQIHVDAPPAPKPVRRPAAPRPPVRGQPAAVAPAIDLNRLRRGFYL